MTEDIKQIALDAVEALKQAQSTIDQLRSQLNKKAGFIAGPDAGLVSSVITGLMKRGSLAAAEAEQMQQLLLSDANASLRCIQQLITAQPTTKTASQLADCTDQLEVGRIVSTNKNAAPQLHYDGREAALRILNT